jgi:hypothetical protein
MVGPEHMTTAEYADSELSAHEIADLRWGPSPTLCVKERRRRAAIARQWAWRHGLRIIGAKALTVLMEGGERVVAVPTYSAAGVYALPSRTQGKGNRTRGEHRRWNGRNGQGAAGV